MKYLISDRLERRLFEPAVLKVLETLPHLFGLPYTDKDCEISKVRYIRDL